MDNGWLREVAKLIHSNATQKGFHTSTPERDETLRELSLLFRSVEHASNLAENERGGALIRLVDLGRIDDETAFRRGRIMLVVTELVELADGIARKDCDNIAEECADVLIRMLDNAAEWGVDIETALFEKMAVNAGRPYLHGKKA